MFINDFLEKYQNITNLKNPLFQPYGDESLQQTIYNKREFNELRLQKVEKKPKTPGELMNHQKIISRYLSTHTMYDRLLLVHEPGTGKSCSAIGTCEKIRKENSTIKGALFLVRGKALADNLINELLFVCTDGEYIPKNYDILTSGEKIARANKSIRKFYKFNTFESFANEIKTKKDNSIIDQYSNLVIVIDEAHNLRIQSGEDQSIYNSFHRFLHLVKNCKVLMMTGTPMKDKPEELASIMNLILPENSQLPTGDEFRNEYLEEVGDEIYKVKDSKQEKLKGYLNGRVSYLKNMQNDDVKKNFVGEFIDGLKFFKVEVDDMGDFQGKVYREALKKDKESMKKDSDEEEYSEDRDEEEKDEKEEEKGDKKDKKSGIYSNSRQASLFVYPDGSYGKDGFKKYIEETKTESQETGKILSSFKLNQELKSLLKGKTVEETLENIRKYSSKYHRVISEILNNKGKNSFVYGEFVQGSGIILFSKLLELVGFSKASGTETKEGLRYAIISNLTSSTTTIKKLISKFNSKENKNGDFIRVIIGSQVIGEGFSLKNVQDVHILTPHWNYSETDQAIARGFRLFSHKDLGRDIIVNIHQHASKFGKVESIDVVMYLKSEKKDISIKNIERLIKEASFDCALNKERNTLKNYDGFRECDYQECEYKCDNFNLEEYRDDLLTYNLFYSRDLVVNISKKIEEIFINKFTCTFEEIRSLFPENTQFQILSALSQIINEKISIQNKFGFNSYLSEKNNIYYLTDNLSFYNQYTDYTYYQSPILHLNVDFENSFYKVYGQHLPQILQNIIETEGEDEKEQILRHIPLPLQEDLLEVSVLAENKKIKHNSNFRRFLMEYYKNSINKIGKTTVSNLLFETEDVLRCLNGETWDDCPEDFEEKIDKILEEKKKELEDTEYGYHAIINKKSGNFLIRDVSNKEILDLDDNRKIPKGKVCTSWDRADLVKIAHAIKLKVPDEDFCKDKTKEELIDLTSKTKYKNAAKAFNKKELSKMTLSEVCRIVYFGGLMKKPFCSILKDWFIKNKLVIEV